MDGIPELADCSRAVESCYWWGLYDRRPLASWTSGRLVLLGDAAHAMLPHLGQGANQAIEDGVALAVFLEGETRTKSQIFCRDMKNFAAPEPTVFKLKRGKQAFGYDSKHNSLEERDREIAKSGEFRKSLYDYDVEKAAIEHVTAA